MKLFDLFKRARSTDPVTSFEAAEQVKPDKHFAMIVECLKQHGPLGKDGIASRLGLESSAVSRRLPELQKMGVIKLTGNIVKSSKNRNEREWTV
jgi:predicted ArsR family transcriptional regulator